MSQMNNQDTGLSYQILTSKRPGLSRGLPPGKEDLAGVANSATLISGQRDSGKNLIALYITHGHGDRFFGLVPLLELPAYQGNRHPKNRRSHGTTNLAGVAR